MVEIIDTKGFVVLSILIDTVCHLKVVNFEAKKVVEIDDNFVTVLDYQIIVNLVIIYSTKVQILVPPIKPRTLTPLLVTENDRNISLFDEAIVISSEKTIR